MPYAVAMGPDHSGYVRLYGRAVTKTLLKRRRGDSGTSVDDENLRQQRMEEMEQRLQQKVEEKMAHRVVNLLTDLMRANPELEIDPNMVAAALSFDRGNNKG